ncbi:MAG: peptidase MA family metallohydrolase [Thermodesulfobacteriota bacterium]
MFPFPLSVWSVRAVARPNIILPCILFILCVASPLHSEEVYRLEAEGVRIWCAPRLKGAAEDLAEIYPLIREAVEGIFGWQMIRSPTVILVNNGAQFERMSGNPLIIAFAEPEKALIVMDWSKLKGNPSTTRAIFKHELCHLLIHQHITRVPVPRWLDEGVAQWASDGMGDIMVDQKRSLLNKAAFNGRFIPLRRLERGFPREKQRLILAYEESKSFTEHLIARFGKEGLLGVLERMQQGSTVPRAIQHTYSVSLYKLEREWQQSVKRRVSWFTYLSYYLYEILFAFGGLVTFFAGIKVFLRKRAYMKQEMETRFEEP